MINPALIGAIWANGGGQVSSWDENDSVAATGDPFTLSNNNDNATASASGNYEQIRAINEVGQRKVYFEIEIVSIGTSAGNILLGASNKTTAYGADWRSQGADRLMHRPSTDTLYENGNGAVYGSTIAGVVVANNRCDATGDVFFCAIDGINDKIWFGSSTSHGVNTWWNSGDPAAGTNEISITNTNLSTWTAYHACDNSGDSSEVRLRAKQSELLYVPPTGFSPLGN